LPHGKPRTNGYHFTSYTSNGCAHNARTYGTADQAATRESAHNVVEKTRADPHGVIHN
jgi:hypothetical protein